MLKRTSQAAHRAVTIQHVAHIEHRSEESLGFNMLVIVTGIRGQNYPSSLCMNANALESLGVTTNAMHTNARCDVTRTVVKSHPVGKHALDHPNHIRQFDTMAELMVAHVASSGIGHFFVLNMELGIWEIVQCANMVIVHVADDDVFDRMGVDSQQCEGLARGSQIGAFALGTNLCSESHIDHQGSVCIADHPDEIIHGHRALVRIST